MHTITFYAPKGGCGRTTATKALASACVARGLRVLVLDTTPPRTLPFSMEELELVIWERRLRKSGLLAPALRVVPVVEDTELPDHLADARRGGIDVVLVDTASDHDPEHSPALWTADLVLAPFTGRMEARMVGESVGALDELPALDVPVFGLATGLDGPDRSLAAILEAFSGRTMRTRLPWVQNVHHAFDRCHQGSWALPYGMTDVRSSGEEEDARTIWRSALDLAAETVWVINDLKVTRGVG